MNQLNHVKSLVLQTVLLTESKRGQFKDRCRVARITQHWVAPTRRPLLQGCHSSSRPPSTTFASSCGIAPICRRPCHPNGVGRCSKTCSWFQILSDMQIHANSAVQLWQRLHHHFVVGSFWLLLLCLPRLSIN